MNRRTVVALALAFVVASAACGSTHPSASPSTTTTVVDAGASSTGAVQFVAEVWADNWFSLFVNGQKVGEDSEPVTRVRSFNAERLTFTASYPLTIAMVTADYTEGDSGLEYIGTPQQQMGDGGFIAQFTEVATGRVVAVTDAAWQGLVIRRAPLDTSCVKAADPATACRYEAKAEPSGWTNPSFDASAWPHASVFTAAQVGPKGGYDAIRWDGSAKLIWSSDLFVDNTILWRTTVPAPQGATGTTR